MKEKLALSKKAAGSVMKRSEAPLGRRHGVCLHNRVMRKVVIKKARENFFVPGSGRAADVTRQRGVKKKRERGGGQRAEGRETGEAIRTGWMSGKGRAPLSEIRVYRGKGEVNRHVKLPDKLQRRGTW